jgi:hypothetical protein
MITTKLTGARSCWSFTDLERDIIKRIVEARKPFAGEDDSEDSGFRHEVKDILHRFLNSLSDGEIITNGYHQGFKEAKDVKRPRDFNEIVLMLGDMYGQNVDVMSDSERAIIKLVQQGGSWAERVYYAISEVVEKLVTRATRPPAED